MPSNIHNNIIFAIDSPTPHNIQAFMSMFNTSPLRSGSLVPCVGSWEGLTEYSFIVNRHDFENIVKVGNWVDNQVCILAVTSCNKMYAQLEYPNGDIEQVGNMHVVHEVEAKASQGYTYRPDVNSYWVAKFGNPDNSYRESCKRVETGEYANG